MSRVWVMGDASVDLMPDDETHYLKCPGGAALNVAVCVARLGGDCGFIGRLGQDDTGAFLRHVFMREGVDVTHLRPDAALTSAVLIVSLDPCGERSFTYLVRPSADTFVTAQDLPVFQPGEWLCFSSIGLTDEPARTACLEAARRMRHAGGSVMFDVNLREAMWPEPQAISRVIEQAIGFASIGKVSADELCRLSGTHHWREARFYLRDRGCPITVISLGDEGAWVISPEGERHFSGFPAQVRDTTGAGDAFVGGLLYTLSCESASLAAAVNNANACGALAVTAKGAITALPNLAQLHQFLARKAGTSL
ncbi:aminoimidazole riboside kinase [Jejubacter calystegiae]|uniref:Aminoimidazole riboside kinase n=1 Tax=Jejubacter calystegiae TaxID=2579935 RepID=A0A4P8YFD2_9ENTR|nr:aminoimidazole riboside kinase [Jejubacter calystegiae]QCT19281.1 aminoimidazole riboside kinase [Jejubacter calystegiae]